MVLDFLKAEREWFVRVTFLLILNIAFMIALWHMDVNHNLDLKGAKKTRGIFEISPEKAYRLSQYGLIISLLLIDLLFLF